MLSSHTSEIPPTADLPQAGRPTDIAGPTVATQPLATSPLVNSAALSYKNALAGSSQFPSSKDNQWTFVGDHDLESGSFNGEPELKISTKFKERLCDPWKKTLVVRLLGRSVSYAYLCSQLRWKWRPVGSLDIIDLNDETFLVTFGSDQDYLHALTGGPWVILDHYLIVHQWSPAFRTSDKPHRRVVAWVQLPELPVHFYHREVLFALGNLIGRTVKLDYHTEKLERGKFARLAIELDMTKSLPTWIRLDGFWQQVLYENIPEICFQCGRIGHLEDKCPSTVNRQPLAIVPVPGTAHHQVSPDETPAEPPAGFGPWMQVTRKSRKTSKSGTTNPGRAPHLPPMAIVTSGKSQAKSAPKGKVDSKSTGLMETKGKVDNQSANKKGPSSKHKGKEVTSEDPTLGGKSQPDKPVKEWRAVAQREPLRDQAQAQPTEASTSNSLKTGPAGKMGPETHTILGANNTTIHLISVPPLSSTLKENKDPNSQSSSSVRLHYQKKQKDQPPVKELNKGVKLKAVKKPVQVAINKRELTNRLKEAAFPVTINAIEELIAQSQHKQTDFQAAKGSKAGDVVMTETLEDNPSIHLTSSGENQSASVAPP
ncbi:unnamed protein product [Linum tenue]|uniref:CCHC-type domain-containing protein n=1 Tax=Linum tenue TaxID=586396 RepID=A0AAV0QXM2_9ROSI|nr:unnamed protein product [Linum tenue]